MEKARYCNVISHNRLRPGPQNRWRQPIRLPCYNQKPRHLYRISSPLPDVPAEKSLRETIGRAPESAQAYFALAALLAPHDRAGEVIPILDALLAQRPATFWALSLKAELLVGERRMAEALAVHEQLLAYKPHAAIPLMNYAHALKAVGRSDDAVTAYRASLRFAPANGFAWWGFANMRTVRLDIGDVATMMQALPAADGLSRVQLHFALGKALGDIGRYAQSFHHYEEGNRLRGALVPYDAEALDIFVRETESRLTASCLAGRKPIGPKGSGAIFIVGMPRSGSTLVEQILASHPMVEGMGELFALRNALRLGLGNDIPDADLPRCISELTDGERTRIATLYLDMVARRRETNRPCFTDKMPSNWQLAGLIHLILPDAHIIDVRRDALACCWSRFMTYFNRDTPAPTSLPDMGRQYRSYDRTMDHFHAALPGRIATVRYEDIVDDLEAVIRRLLASLALPFASDCLSFHTNPRPVHTPSALQVRTRIDRGGLTFWRNYEPWLKPLKDALA